MGSRGVGRGAGKRGRVTHIEGERATHEKSLTPDSQVPTWSEEPSGDHLPSMPPDRKPCTKNKYEICDLYAVGGLGATSEEGMTERPFVHEVQLLGPKGEIVRVRVVFNDGTMICAMCSQIYKKVKHRLQGWKLSKCVLCMVNRVLVKSQVMWTGKVRLGSIQAEGTIEVLDSGGGWLFLFRKLMLQAFKANHDYKPGEG
jgi:hypothetical protein